MGRSTLLTFSISSHSAIMKRSTRETFRPYPCNQGSRRRNITLMIPPTTRLLLSPMILTSRITIYAWGRNISIKCPLNSSSVYWYPRHRMSFLQNNQPQLLLLNQMTTTPVEISLAYRLCYCLTCHWRRLSHIHNMHQVNWPVDTPI